MTFFQQNWFYTLLKKTNKQTKYKQTNVNNNNKKLGKLITLTNCKNFVKQNSITPPKWDKRKREKVDIFCVFFYTNILILFCFYLQMGEMFIGVSNAF